MATTLAGWLADGKPFKMAQPLLDLRASLGQLGYTGPATGYPNLAHLQANPPEDHCPFSHTPWPGAQPYPYCMALDIMPDPRVDWKAVGLALFTAKQAGDPQLGWLKYLNWTDSAGNVWHDSWMPSHNRYASSDSGHVHASCRTDFVTSSVMAGFRFNSDGDTSMFCNYGDNNDKVRALQLLLLKVAPTILPKFGADGDYGDETAAAVSIIVSGGPGHTYGPAEYATLFDVLAAHHATTGPAQLVPHTHALSISGSVAEAQPTA